MASCWDSISDQPRPNGYSVAGGHLIEHVNPHPCACVGLGCSGCPDDGSCPQDFFGQELPNG
jgi:hypothetical protein